LSRSHMRAVRALVAHPSDPLLLSGGDDGNIKVWWLPAVNKKSVVNHISAVVLPSSSVGAFLNEAPIFVLRISVIHCS